MVFFSCFSISLVSFSVREAEKEVSKNSTWVVDAVLKVQPLRLKGLKTHKALKGHTLWHIFWSFIFPSLTPAKLPHIKYDGKKKLKMLS